MRSDLARTSLDPLAPDPLAPERLAPERLAPECIKHTGSPATLARAPMSLILVSTWSILYLDKWLAGLGGLCDFSISQSPFGLDC